MMLSALSITGIANSGIGEIELFQYSSASLVYLISIVFTIIYTVRIYSYLHNKRKADLYGSLPIGRATLFIAKSVSAYLMSLIRFPQSLSRVLLWVVLTAFMLAFSKTASL